MLQNLGTIPPAQLLAIVQETTDNDRAIAHAFIDPDVRELRALVLELSRRYQHAIGVVAQLSTDLDAEINRQRTGGIL
jgi:hypothetical protein